MDWCVAETFSAANHNPVVAINNDKSKAVARLTVKPGETVELSAAGTSDPDGDEIAFRWFVYKEAGDYDGTISIQNGNTIEARFIAPQVSQTRNVHVILEVKDDGKPNLYSYRRIIVTVKP
jgi:hypothetical protein